MRLYSNEISINTHYKSEKARSNTKIELLLKSKINNLSISENQKSNRIAPILRFNTFSRKLKSESDNPNNSELKMHRLWCYWINTQRFWQRDGLI